MLVIKFAFLLAWNVLYLLKLITCKIRENEVELQMISLKVLDFLFFLWYFDNKLSLFDNRNFQKKHLMLMYLYLLVSFKAIMNGLFSQIEMIRNF